MKLDKSPKPNVGILSMQRVINYGSFLQAYALRELLKQAGAGSVSFVDIEPGRILVEVPSKFVRRFKALFKVIFTGQVIERSRNLYFFPKLKKTFHESAWPELRLDNPEHTKFDLMVIGSDEVFNCCQECGAGYTPQLFGRISSEISPRVATYAASFGFTTLSMLQEYGVAKEIAETLKGDEAISVRDVNSQDIVESLTGKRPPLHLDPVLMYGFKDEILSFEQRPTDEKYMVVYTYGERMKSRKEIQAVKNYAKSRGLKIYCVYCWYNWGDKVIIPEQTSEVLKWFKYAECVVTDTFHGTIFSVITHRRFATFLRPSNYNKLSSLLSSVGLPAHAVNDVENMATTLDQKIDYTAIETNLDVERRRTNDYLKELIKR